MQQRITCTIIMTGDVAVKKMSKQAKNYYSLQKKNRAKGKFLHLSTYLTPLIQIRKRTVNRDKIYTKNISFGLVAFDSRYSNQIRLISSILYS